MNEIRSSPSGDTGTYEVVITTENLDRYQEIIRLHAWDDERYLAN